MFARLQAALEGAWSIETSSRWRRDNPALGQCSVTALVVHDILGGELAKTEIGGAWHFYNIVRGERLDFSASQFAGEVDYFDLPASRDEALLDASPEQYRILRQRVLANLGQS